MFKNIKREVTNKSYADSVRELRTNLARKSVSATLCLNAIRDCDKAASWLEHNHVSIENDRFKLFCLNNLPDFIKTIHN